MSGKYLDEAGLAYFWTKLKSYFKQNTLDTFYPVGSYYETSDASFDPNVSWGGTWELEASGNVHVSSGTGYTIGATGGEATHVLTPSETATKNHSHTINHGHSFTNPTLPNHVHSTGGTASEGTDRFLVQTSNSSGGVMRRSIKPGSGTALAGNYYNADAPITRKQNTGNPTSNPSCSGGSVTGHTGSSGGQTEANGSAHNNMPPYIVINRWHRTA